MNTRLLLVLGGAAAALLVSPLASADLLPPGVGCDGKKAGDECKAYWKAPTGGMPRGEQGPGKCVDESHDDGHRSTTCRPLAAPGIDGVTYADGACSGKRVGDACAGRDQMRDMTGTCAPQAHRDHGKILACVASSAAAVASAAGSAVPSATPSAAASTPAPGRSTEYAAGREGSKSCSCTLPGGGTPAGEAGVAALMVLAGVLAGRRRRG